MPNQRQPCFSRRLFARGQQSYCNTAAAVVISFVTYSWIFIPGNSTMYREKLDQSRRARETVALFIDKWAVSGRAMETVQNEAWHVMRSRPITSRLCSWIFMSRWQFRLLPCSATCDGLHFSFYNLFLRAAFYICGGGPGRLYFTECTVVHYCCNYDPSLYRDIGKSGVPGSATEESNWQHLKQQICFTGKNISSGNAVHCFARSACDYSLDLWG